MTDQVDKILTHPILGIPAFFGIMALVFFLTFTVGDFLKGYFEQGLELLSLGVLSGLHSAGASDWVISLVVDGCVGWSWRNPDISSKHLYPFPCACVPGGQRVHGKSRLCHE